MATTTAHYGFTKPGMNDYADISVINTDLDNIDTAIYNNQVRSQAALDDIAPEYDATATYSVGDYVIYNKTLYRCTTAVTTAEAFDDTKWTAEKVGGELKSHDARISTLEAGIDLEKSATNSFDDGIDSYFKKVISTIVPVQAGSGTPSPTNKRAISGFTECTVKDNGKNLCSIASFTMGGASTTVEGLFKANTYAISFDTTTAGVNISAQFRNADDTATIKQNGTTTVSGRNTIPLNLEEDTTKFRFFSSNTITITNVQIEAGTTATTYEPYTANTATISFGSAGTVYGARVELISGKLVVNRAYKELDGTESWTRYSTSDTNTVLSVASPITNVASYNQQISSHFTFNSQAYAIASGREYTFTVETGSRRIFMQVPTSVASTGAAFQTWLADQKANGTPVAISVEVEPQEFQLTPAQLRSLVGANRLTSSTGEVTETEYITNETIAWLLDLIRA